MPRPSLLPAAVLVVAVAVVTLVTPNAFSPISAATDPAVAPAAARVAAYTPPAEELLFTDPHRHPHEITEELLRLIRNTPRHASIEVSTYFLGSSLLEKALAAAYRRGVRVRVILTRGTRGEYAAGRRLAAVLDRDRRDTSWLRWANGSARGTDGVDHQKIYRFSEVGARRWITVVGSMNSSSSADHSAYSQMLLVSRRAVYDWFRQTFRQAGRDRPVRPDPMRRIHRSGWSAYVFPTTEQSPASDPVMARLVSIPSRPGTTIRIAMYSMWDTRGTWIAQRLAEMARRGARITVLLGPPVAQSVIDTLVTSGVTVRGGCFGDGTYVHNKDMTATYTLHGRVHRWTWVGSDNWTSRGQNNDEAVLGVDDRRIQRQFLAHYRTMWDRPGSVMPASCHPRRG